jgi:hypothetical protein
MSKDDDSLTKVRIGLPNHWAAGGESLWAPPLGDDLYEIRNAPFYAYGINWGDIVRAYSAEPKLEAEVREVVKRSGNRTLRVFFDEEPGEEAQEAVLLSLQVLGASWERADERYVAIDVHPEADYDAVCERISGLANQGILGYETCEARVPNSFDDTPSEDAGRGSQMRLQI